LIRVCSKSDDKFFASSIDIDKSMSMLFRESSANDLQLEVRTLESATMSIYISSEPWAYLPLTSVGLLCARLSRFSFELCSFSL
jgi:hypothetical protein